MDKLKALRPGLLPVTGGVISCLFWFVDSAIDTYIFNSKRLYLEELLRPDSTELLSRSQVIILVMALSFISMALLRKQQKISAQLLEYKTELENAVEERTSDLSIKNTILENEIMERLKNEAQLIQLASIDPLTSINNRRKFNDVLHYELNRDERYHNKLSLIFCDLDHFKAINDKFGHNIGDDVLKVFTRLISGNIRKTDIFARWGGEEFALLLPETDIYTAAQMAEKLREATEAFVFPYVEHITASFGVTQFFDEDNESEFVSRADDALYIAKESGRNTVEVLPPLKQKHLDLSENHHECLQDYS